MKLQRRSATAGCLSETVVAGDPHTGGQAGAATPAEDALHLELGNVFGNARCFFAELKSDNDFFEGLHGDFVGAPAWRVRPGAVEDREFEIVFGSEHD